MSWNNRVGHWIAIPVCGLLLLSAAAKAQGESEPTPGAPSTGVEELVAANNRMAWTLAAHLPAEGNQLVAPLPLMMELRKLASGAQGATLRELTAASGVPKSVNDADYVSLVASLLRAAVPPQDADEEPMPQQNHTLALASSLWADDRITLDLDYSQRIEVLQGSPLELVSFREPLSIQDRLDKWVRSATDGQIRKVSLPNLGNDALGVIGLSALHLQSGWMTPYSIRDTKTADFYCTPERKQSVRMMRCSDKFDYTEDELAQVVRQGAAGVEVLFLLPRDGVGVVALEQRLADGLVDRYRSALKHESGTIRIPRFEFESSLDLVPMLRELGVTSAFDPERAQLFGASKGAELVLASLQSRIAIDEEGLSAGSVTLFGGRFGGTIGKPPPPFEFTANRPFLIVIRHSATGAVLFVGRYAGPDTDTR